MGDSFPYLQPKGNQVDFLLMYQLSLTTFKKYLWVVCLVIVLVSTQGAPLHAHIYDHDSATPGHAHLDQIHFFYDTNVEHHDNFVVVDLANQGILRNLSFGSLFIAFFMAVIILLLPRFFARVSRLRGNRALYIPWRGLLPPSLRAPPL